MTLAVIGLVLLELIIHWLQKVRMLLLLLRHETMLLLLSRGQIVKVLDSALRVLLPHGIGVVRAGGERTGRHHNIITMLLLLLLLLLLLVVIQPRDVSIAGICERDDRGAAVRLFHARGQVAVVAFVDGVAARYDGLVEWQGLEVARGAWQQVGGCHWLLVGFVG